MFVYRGLLLLYDNPAEVDNDINNNNNKNISIVQFIQFLNHKDAHDYTNCDQSSLQRALVAYLRLPIKCVNKRNMIYVTAFLYRVKRVSSYSSISLTLYIVSIMCIILLQSILPIVFINQSIDHILLFIISGQLFQFSSFYKNLKCV